MNWEEVGAIGQVLGSIAVFVTLVYLAIQTRQAKEATQRSISQARAEALRHAFQWGAEPRMAEIGIKVNKALGARPNPFNAKLIEEVGLTREEAAAQFQFEMIGWINRVQTIAAIGGMNSIERQQFDFMLVMLYGGDRGVARMFYDWMKPNAHPDVVQYIEGALTRRAS